MSASREDTSGESEVDEFPDLNTLVRRAGQAKPTIYSAQPPAKAPSVRRRRLAPVADNVLLKAWNHDAAARAPNDLKPSTPDTTKKRANRPKAQLRTGVDVSVVEVAVTDKGEHKSKGITPRPTNLEEEATATGLTELRNTSPGNLDANASDDWDEGSGLGRAAKRQSAAKENFRSTDSGSNTSRDKALKSLSSPTDNVEKQRPKGVATAHTIRAALADDDLADAINHLRLDDAQPRTASRLSKPRKGRQATPPDPVTPPKLLPGLVSPRKLSRIPATPHHPSTDLFWSRDFVDDWNDEHSPKKQLFAEASKEKPRQSGSPKKKAITNKPTADREAKKAFEKAKHQMAESFLYELDRTITQGRLWELAETTGGIKLNWTNKLNTTAGRANWKRETVRTKNPDGTEASVKHRHHASIELAEKVIDNEHRLLNVVAHEFCHLANFMVTGITNNPHGKEFKDWAAKCSRAFGDRGIDVTTKHSYDIDFKYVWECTTCAMEYKRHSKSINPDRHRCGGCKSQLKQTRPVPRAGAGKPSEYQKFMKEQVKLLREEDPKSPQKDIMKRVADRWTSQQASSKATDKSSVRAVSLEAVAVSLEELDLDAAGGR